MRASRAVRVSLSAALSLTLLVGVMPAAGAGPSLPVPASIAAVGDSITRAASTGGTLGADAPHNSWSTGTSTSVNSHFLRLASMNSSLIAHNHAVSGAKVADLEAQMLSVASLDPDPGYLTVLIGGNDLCTDTVDEMTSVTDFHDRFARAMATITARSPGTRVYVVSIPDVYQLWNLFKNNFWARFVWSSADICQSLLANPTSTQQVDVQRRAQVRQRNIDFNTQLAAVCAQYAAACHFDGNAVFNTAFTASDVSGDYFHPSVAGQAKLASVSWNAGYVWQPPNKAPMASFTSSCSGLTCTFDDTSTDADGTIASRSWSFGGSSDPQSHTFASAGTYTVTLTVTDDDGATAAASHSVTVSDAPPPTMRIGDLSATRTRVSSSTWQATVTILVTTPAGAPVSGAKVFGSWSVGAADVCTTGSAGSCTATSDTLSRSGTRSVTFTVTGAEHSTHLYDASANAETSITVTRP